MAYLIWEQKAVDFIRKGGGTGSIRFINSSRHSRGPPIGLPKWPVNESRKGVTSSRMITSSGGQGHTLSPVGTNTFSVRGLCGKAGWDSRPKAKWKAGFPLEHHLRSYFQEDYGLPTLAALMVFSTRLRTVTCTSTLWQFPCLEIPGGLKGGCGSLYGIGVWGGRHRWSDHSLVRL